MASASLGLPVMPQERMVITNSKYLFKKVNDVWLSDIIDELELSIREHSAYIDLLDSMEYLYADDNDMDWFIQKYNELLGWWNEGTMELSARKKAAQL